MKGNPQSWEPRCLYSSLCSIPSPNSYLFAKTTPTGLTTFFGLRLDSETQTVYFDYRPEGLDEGYRTVAVTGVNVSDGRLHHVAVSVFGSDLILFLDGRSHLQQSLIAALEDGPGVFFIGRKLGEETRLQGTSRKFLRAFNGTPYPLYHRPAVFCVLLRHDSV